MFNITIIRHYVQAAYWAIPENERKLVREGALLFAASIGISFLGGDVANVDDSEMMRDRLILGLQQIGPIFMYVWRTLRPGTAGFLDR